MKGYQASKAKRDLSQEEFLKTLELLRKVPDWNHQYKYPCMTLGQYHLIGRIDDTAHFQVGDPRGHEVFDFALQTKVRRSKNVLDERRCPDQILMGAMHDDYCILLMIAIYLESFLEQHPNASLLFTDHTMIQRKHLIT